jgi:OmpA-OmpF porin, OOP family
MIKNIPLLTFLFLLCSEFGFCQSVSSDSIPINLGKQINSKHPDIAPIISPDGKTLYFSKDHIRQEIERDKNRFGYVHMTVVEYQHIYYSSLNELGEWDNAKRMADEMNTAEFNALCSISPDGNSILVYKSPKLFISKKNGNSWGKLVEQKIDHFYDSSNFCNFFLSNSGKYLLSSSTRYKKYKEDIYVSFLLEENHWSQPIDLGIGINSKSREISPFLASDDHTIYFASDRWGGLGEMDIYMSHRHDSSWTDWSPPRNLGAPINSEVWDAYFSLPASGDYAYYVSTQSGLGQEDIFKIKLPEWARPHPLNVFTGKVLDKKSGKPLSAEITYNQLEDEDEGGKTFSDQVTGEFKIAIHADDDYEIIIRKEGYLPLSVRIDSISNLNYMEFYLTKIEIAVYYHIDPVYFDFNKVVITDSSFSMLTIMLEFLVDNPLYKIKLIGYTDNFGDSNYNKKLSIERAKGVKKYLTGKGIEETRISIEGLGETKPASSNDTEEGRKKNRRVELEIMRF